MSRDMIVFGEDWGGLPSSTQHLLRHLSESRKVVWINSIGLRRPTLNRRDIGRAWRKLTATRRAPGKSAGKPVNENFHILHPRTLPAPRHPLTRKIAGGLLAAQIRPLVQKAGLQSPIVWASLPTAIDAANRLDGSALVYYCGDDFSALAGVDHTTVAARESELVEKADLIIAASETLSERFPPDKTHLLPHGVDYRLFATPAPRADDLPNDGRPIAGFYGSLSEWLDLELLQKTIAKLPDWHFVFIGKPVIETEPLSRFPNVRLLGERRHEQLPGYAQHWTASLLPFRDTPQIRACNPLKLREYLAAGRPVVSTSFAALKPYRHHIHTVTDAGSMAGALQKSARQSLDISRQEAVGDHTWSARAVQVEQWLEAL